MDDAGSKYFAKPNPNSIAGWRQKQVPTHSRFHSMSTSNLRVVISRTMSYRNPLRAWIHMPGCPFVDRCSCPAKNSIHVSDVMIKGACVARTTRVALAARGTRHAGGTAVTRSAPLVGVPLEQTLSSAPLGAEVLGAPLAQRCFPAHSSSPTSSFTLRSPHVAVSRSPACPLNRSDLVRCFAPAGATGVYASVGIRKQVQPPLCTPFPTYTSTLVASPQTPDTSPPLSFPLFPPQRLRFYELEN